MGTSIIFHLETVNEETVITDDTSFASLSSEFEDIQVMKSKTVRSKDGVITFDDVILIGQPHSYALLKLTSQAIDPYKNLNSFGIENKQIYMLAYLRPCEAGEQQTADNKCVLC